MTQPISSLRLARWERAATPLPFCEYLIGLVHPHAVLWVCRGSFYERNNKRFDLDLWGVDRDAWQYAGPGPIIAHPPCGPWGRLAWSSTEDRGHGIRAMELVHRYGGVVEQPEGSQLFKQHGRPGATILKVDQFDYGHRALKPTILYLWQVHSGL